MNIQVERVLVPGALALVMAASAVRADDVRVTPFAHGETLTYAVTWSVFSAGDIVIALRKAGSGPADDVEAEARARSQGFVSMLFKVDDDLRSVFNPQTFCSRSVLKKTNEGRHHRQSRIIFDATRQMAVLDERDLAHPNEPEKHAESATGPCVQDLVSAFYFLRRQPLVVGHEITMPVSDGSKTVRVTVNVDSRETIPTSLGGRRAAFRVEPRIFGGLYNRKGRLFIWISDDEQRLPLRIRGESSVGTVTGNLKSVTFEPEKGLPAEPQTSKTPSQVK